MKLAPEDTISDIVRADYRTADVFKKYDINYCCSGQMTLASACATRKVDIESVLSELTEATRNIHVSRSIRFKDWNIGFLIEYIVNLHHQFLAHAIPAIETRLAAFVNSHGGKYPEMEKIRATFSRLATELLEHTKEEEDVIFPYIMQIDAAQRGKEPYGKLLVKTMRKPLEKNAREHEAIGRLLAQLQAEANDFEIPENACVTHQVIYFKLRELHDDIVQHTHLENNVLIPKAVAIEKELLEFGG